MEETIPTTTKKKIDFNIIKHKLSGTVMYILILVVVFQAGGIAGWLIHRNQVDKEIRTAIIAEAFVYDDFKDKKFNCNKVLYQIKKFEILQQEVPK